MAMLPYHVFECGRDHLTEYVTVWDGTGAGASGTRYLDAVEEPRPGQKPPRQTHTDRILAALAGGPRTARSLADELAHDIGGVSGTLYGLRMRRLVAIVGQKPVDPQKNAGRTSEHVYALAGGQ